MLKCPSSKPNAQAVFEDEYLIARRINDRGGIKVCIGPPLGMGSGERPGPLPPKAQVIDGNEITVKLQL